MFAFKYDLKNTPFFTLLDIPINSSVSINYVSLFFFFICLLLYYLENKRNL